jgi:TetR/AcrR family transcriptional regulator
MVKPNNKTIRVRKGRNSSHRLNGSTDSTEQKILVAAREEFIARGLGGARMQAIADRAGVNKALVHYYFRSKDRLYGAVLENIFRTIGSAFRDRLSKENGAEDLRSLLRLIVTVYVKTLQLNPDFPRFILREIVDGGAHLHGLVEIFFANFADIPQRIYSLLVRETRSGRLRPIPPVHFALNLIGMSLFAFIARPMVNAISEEADLNITFDDDFFEQRIDAIVTMACDGIFKEKRS